MSVVVLNNRQFHCKYKHAAAGISPATGPFIYTTYRNYTSGSRQIDSISVAAIEIVKSFFYIFECK
jgi:hypothetical protein